MKHFIFLSLFLVPSIVYGVSNKQLNKIKKYNHSRHDQLIYMHIDRECYAPGDTIWFKAYVREKSQLTKSDLSHYFQVDFRSRTYDSISGFRFLIRDGQSQGYIPIDKDAPEGMGYLFYYTSWMKNAAIQSVAHKKVWIQRKKPLWTYYAVEFDKDRYVKGDSITFFVKWINRKNMTKDYKHYKCWVTNNGKTIFKSPGQTSTTAPMYHSFVMDDTIKGDFKLKLIGNASEDKMFEREYSIAYCDKLHVGFYPEGGRNYNGIMSNMAFKVVGSDGMPINVKGDLIDDKGQVLAANITSTHDGMGEFLFQPSNGIQYYFHLKHPKAFEEKIEIPKASSEGVMLMATMQSDEIRLMLTKINTSSDSVNVAVRIRDKIVFIQTIMLDGLKKMTIPTSGFPHGIATITIFDPNLIPMAERLLYIPPTNQYKVSITPKDQAYGLREKVDLIIDVKDNVGDVLKGDFSITAYDYFLGESDKVRNPDIRSSFLFTPEIKGYIHNPEYYLANTEDTTLSGLDLLLLTQGWRSYPKLSLLDTTPIIAPSQKESISGTVFEQPFGRKYKPLSGELTVFCGGLSQTIFSDSKGRFTFIPDFSYSLKPNITIDARDDRSPDNINVVLDTLLFDKALKVLYRDLKNTADTFWQANTYSPIKSLKNTSAIDKNHVLLEAFEVFHNQPKRLIETKDFLHTTQSMNQFNNYLNASFVTDIIPAMGVAMIKEEGDIQYVFCPQCMMHVPPQEDQWVPLYYVINDRLYGSSDGPDYSYLKDLQVANIKDIYFAKGYEVLVQHGSKVLAVVNVTTHNGFFYDPKLDKKHNTPLVSVRGFISPAQRYSPVYDSDESINNRIPDERKTLCWQPQLKFNALGQSQLSFYTADRYTKVKCVVEGISDAGIPVYGTGYFNIDR
ncbi:hypothetical protein OAO55_01980 [Bacteroidales bacterium]|nr:hypothetical protein [Bacteroidales bacterium]